jgi:hypothetical protein
LLNSPDRLIDNFITSRRQGLSPRTLEFYRDRLTRAKCIVGTGLKSQEIKRFFDNLKCSNGGKHAYWRGCYTLCDELNRSRMLHHFL